MIDVGAQSWGDCPPSVILDRFISGALPADEDERVKRHVEGCSACAAKLAGHDGDTELERLLLAQSETPIVSLQEADDILERIKRPIRTGAAGRRADRRFRFTEREVAKGGMGVVHEGVDTEMGRTVAVKRLKDEYAADRRDITVRTRSAGHRSTGAPWYRPGLWARQRSRWETVLCDADGRR
jgi:hypothetical protein